MEIQPSETPKTTATVPKPPNDRTFLTHLELYLAKRDGVDKLLKISRYAAKIALAANAVPSSHPLHARLKSFEASVGVSRKAFRLGKFVQDVNALQNTCSGTTTREHVLLSLLAYGGEGLYYFVEQFVWLAKTGLIDAKHLRNLGKISAWAEMVGYIGSIGLKIRDLKRIGVEERCLVESVRIAVVRGDKCGEEMDKLIKLRQKKTIKRLSVVQDLADGLMALADIRDGNGRLAGPLLLSSAGLLSALISTHKNWLAC